MLVKPAHSSHRRVRGNKAWEWGGGFFKTGRRACGQEKRDISRAHASRLTPQHVPCGGGDDLTEPNYAKLDQVLCMRSMDREHGRSGNQGVEDRAR